METLVVERDGGIVTVTLDRPRRKNAMDATMFAELKATFRNIAGREDDRVVVVTGAGGEFCSGADLGDASGNAVHKLTWMRGVGEVAVALHALPQPVIAKVRGVAVGAGANLALGCDLIAAAEGARFSQIFARRGLTIDFGGSYVLPRLVGLHKAKELALLGDIIDAGEAHILGIVNRVVPDAEVDDLVDGWARKLAAGPPLALSMTKKLLNASLTSTLEEALEGEAVAQALNFETEDTAEAMVAFAEKRDPVFKGR
ncbi:MAG: enoyl-CoA hydratase [Acidimicrobiia bacterium]|jgi:2-(1,2-epoxy-1,2-dihydrophenyl)acetyl-CoA isomerase|nr:enoyl-CoA hydratase [Acidimicrobiia bacterium]